MNTKEKIKIMQAFEDGEDVQCGGDDIDWETLERDVDPDWLWDKVDYRIKPEPEILGCPFCGHEAQKGHSFEKDYYIQCSNLDCVCILEQFGDKESALKDWNRRTQ